MKIISIFTKTPQHRKFSYTPRFYNPDDEERKNREDRIRKEVEKEQGKDIDYSEYRSRIAGSFRSARRPGAQPVNPSASLIRLVLLTFFAFWLYAFIEFGNVAFYGLLLLVPFYFFLKLKDFKRRS